jgi:hypothetical protein
MVPTFTTHRSTREVPSYTPAASPRVRRSPSPWPPHRSEPPGFGVTRPVFTAGAHDRPTQIRQVGVGSTLTGPHALVPCVHLLVLLAGPEPSGSADPSRRCQDRLPPSPASPRSGCPQLLPGCYDSPAAGSCTPLGHRGASWRTNRSSNRRSGSSVAQWCSLVWIPSTRASACSGVGHSASVFTGDLLAFQSVCCEPAAALRHVAGFPGLGLLRRLRPTQAPTVDSGPARHQPGRPAGRAAPGRFPRSCCDRLTGEVASCAPAASPRVRRRPSPWPPDRR